MKPYESWEIGEHVIEYLDDCHCYVCDGILVPSITQILKTKFGNKYDGVDRETLKRASEKGTAVHEAIETYCKTGVANDFPEVRNFKFLQGQYQFKVLDNEIPVAIWMDDFPICCGRLDLLLELDGEKCLADIKRTSVLDKEYLAYQLNLYRIGYIETYGSDIKYLRGIHLRDDTRKFVNIPINEKMAMDLVNEYLEQEDKQ